MKINTIKILITLLFLINAGTAQNWQIAGQMPFPVSGGQAIATDSLIYILGGQLDSANIRLNIIQAYDPVNSSWSTAGFMKESRYGFVSFLYSDSLIFSCGGVWENSIHLFSIEKWNFLNEGNSNSQVYNYNPNFGRIYSTGQLIGDDLYIIGGLSAPPLSDSLDYPYIIRYHIPTSTITFQQDSIYGGGTLPYHQMSVSKGNEIYIFGGVHFSVTNSITRFNLGSSIINTGGLLNGVRAGGDAVVYGDSIYVIGGYNESIHPLQTVEIYNTQNGNVTNGPSLNYARSELMAAVFKNKIYVFGGKNAFGVTVPYFETLDFVTAIEPVEPEIAHGFQLNENYPNPFNGETVISFQLNQPADIRLDIFSVTGQHILTLAQKKFSAGIQKFTWNGRDKKQNDVSSGIYIYRLQSERFSVSKKMLLIR